MKTAIISVSDKTGIIEFANKLTSLNFKIYSTGGTLKLLKENGISVNSIKDLTQFPEILNGRVKTLHPKVHGGILAKRGDPTHDIDRRSNAIELIDLVVVNLYPFQATVAKEDVTWAEAIENIDIGGPTMVRSAAKNHAYVSILTNPEQYEVFIEALKEDTVDELRPRLALEAFKHTAEYDKAISTWMGNEL